MWLGSEKAVDDLLAEFPFRSQPSGLVRYPEHRFPELHNPAMFEAIRKMHEHEARTGHKVWKHLFPERLP